MLIPAKRAGQVFDVHRSPLSFPVIRNLTSGMWSTGDENGYFNLNCTLGDSIHVTRYGYENVQMIIDEKPLNVFLNTQPILMAEITIKPTRLPSAGNSQTFTVNDLATGHIAAVFREIPRGSIRSYGGHAGNAAFSLDGGPAAHTKIILDEVDVTSPQNGESDLSQIPIELISSVSSSALQEKNYGSGAIDGIVCLIPESENNALQLGMGSWGYASWSMHKSVRSQDLTGSIVFGQKKARENYPVSWRGQSFQRENNDFAQAYFYASAQKNFNYSTLIKSMFMFSDHQRGVAGQVQSPSSAALRHDQLALGAVKLTRLLQNGYVALILSSRISDENYADPGYNIDSRHSLSSHTANISGKLRLNDRIILRSLLQTTADNIQSSDAGEHSRYTYSAGVTFFYTHNRLVDFSSAFRLDNISGSGTYPTWNMHMGIHPSNHFTHEVSVGTAFKTPSFNDLYWVPGGKADLKPETAISGQYNAAWDYEQNHVDLTLKRVDSRQLIQWVPAGQNWSPENIASSTRTSISVSCSKSWEWFEFTGHLMRLKSVNHSTAKALLYAPEYSGNGQLKMTFSDTDLGFNIRFTGERIAMYGFPGDDVLPAHWIGSFFLQRTQQFSNRSITLNFTAENIFDLQYATIQGYPEPGRSFYFKIKFM